MDEDSFEFLAIFKIILPESFRFTIPNEIDKSFTVAGTIQAIFAALFSVKLRSKRRWRFQYLTGCGEMAQELGLRI
jgi:hypothetical protein